MGLNDLARLVMKTKDYSKLFLWGAKLYLGNVVVWPGGQHSWKNTAAFIFHATGLIFISVGIFLRVLKNADNFNKMTFALCMFIIPILVSFKSLFLWYKSQELKQLLQQIMTKFWTYDLCGGQSKAEILKVNSYSNTFVAVFSVNSILYSIILFVLPLFLPKRTLPLEVEYPFDWRCSPIYEFLYCQQIFTFSLTMVSINMGMDYLILGLLLSISSQFCILRECLSIFNTDEMYPVNKKMRNVLNDKLEENYDETKEFFVRCVRHHQLLLSFSKKLNSVLNPLEFSQLAFTCFALCLGALRLTGEEVVTVLQLIISMVFIIGFVMQLSIDCFLGTHLYFEASLLPDATFQCNWVNLENNILKKDVMFLINNSQRIPQFNTYKVYDLHMTSFVKVLKLAFSMYTLLSSLGKK